MRARICAHTSTISSDAEDGGPDQISVESDAGSAVVSPSHVMVTVSPPVSPSVVARTLMIQKPSVTAGTLLRGTFFVRHLNRTPTHKVRGVARSIEPSPLKAAITSALVEILAAQDKGELPAQAATKPKHRLLSRVSGRGC